MTSSSRVYYFYDPNIGCYHYGPGHPMKPLRIRMAHNLTLNYGLHKHMNIMKPTPATIKQLTRFHSDEYIDFLNRVNPENVEEFVDHNRRFNVGDDCPVFDGLYEFCSLSAGGSIDAANKLNQGCADVAINYGGGLHHAKQCEASGFCYVNDIALSILELLRYHQRVLYVDIDIHHGDGVEEAFYTTDRVMTVSFHKYGEYFPGTGDIKDTGIGKGKHYAVNVPLRDGINDESYRSIFVPIIEHVLKWFKPGAIVLQTGADSLAGDKLGCFNLSMRGHGACVQFMKNQGIPLLIVGGGGYTIKNVARVWTYETSIICGQELNPTLPYNDFFEFYGPDYRLDVPMNNMHDYNTPEYLQKVQMEIVENLRNIPFAPSIQMQEVPRDYDYSEDEDEDEKSEQNEGGPSLYLMFTSQELNGNHFQVDVEHKMDLD